MVAFILFHHYRFGNDIIIILSLNIPYMLIVFLFVSTIIIIIIAHTVFTGGCMCAGPYSQSLLGISVIHNQQIETALLDKHEVLRPG